VHARARARGTFLPLLSKRIGGLAFFLITYRLSVADGIVASASPRHGQVSKFELLPSRARARVLAEFLARGTRPDVRKFPCKFVRQSEQFRATRGSRQRAVSPRYAVMHEQRQRQRRRRRRRSVCTETHDRKRRKPRVCGGRSTAASAFATVRIAAARAARNYTCRPCNCRD